jgi:hypothetical protein
MGDRRDSNRRANQRKSMVNVAWYRHIDGDREGMAHSYDVSSTGVSIVLPHPIEKSSRLFLELTGRDLNISAIVEVVHSLPHGEFFRIGARFLLIPPNDRIALTTWLSKSLRPHSV